MKTTRPTRKKQKRTPPSPRKRTAQGVAVRCWHETGPVKGHPNLNGRVPGWFIPQSRYDESVELAAKEIYLNTPPQDYELLRRIWSGELTDIKDMYRRRARAVFKALGIQPEQTRT